MRFLRSRVPRLRIDCSRPDHLSPDYLSPDYLSVVPVSCLAIAGPISRMTKLVRSSL